MVQASEPFENRPKSTIRKPDMSGFQIPTVSANTIKWGQILNAFNFWTTVGIWIPDIQIPETLKNPNILVTGFQMVRL